MLSSDMAEQIRAARLRGLAANPAVPDAVLIESIEAAPDEALAGIRRRRELCRALQEAMFRSGHRQVRAALGWHPPTYPDVRERLLHDARWSVSFSALEGPGMTYERPAAVRRAPSDTAPAP